MLFVVADGFVTRLPEFVELLRQTRQILLLEKLRVHAHRQHFLVITAVEHTDAPAARQTARGAPEKIVVEILRRRLLERIHLAAGRINPGEHSADGAVLAGRVHRLEYQQHRMVVMGVEDALQLIQLFNLLLQLFLVFFFVRRGRRWPRWRLCNLEAAVERDEIRAVHWGKAILRHVRLLS